MNKIEIENADEVLRALEDEPRDNASAPKHNPEVNVKAYNLNDPSAPTIKDLMATLLAEADEWQNVVVVRFNVKHDPNEGCQAKSDLRMAVAGPHEAIHGAAMMDIMLDALKQKIVDTFLGDLLDRFFNRKPKENL